MAGPLGVPSKTAHPMRRRRRVDGQPDVDAFEIRRLVVNVVLFRVEERGPHVGRGIQNWHVVQRREPRHLGEQSKGGSHHQVLQWARALFGAAAGGRLVRLDHETTHAPLQVDVVQNPRRRTCGHPPLVARFAGEVRSDSLDLASLLGQIDATLTVRLHAPIVPSIGRRTVRTRHPCTGLACNACAVGQDSTANNARTRSTPV